MKTSTRKAIRIAIEEAQDILAKDYGIDFSLYGKAKWEFWRDPATGREDDFVEAGLVSGSILWQHKKSKQHISMSEVYVKVEDGTIEQYGSNYGVLAL